MASSGDSLAAFNACSNELTKLSVNGVVGTSVLVCLVFLKTLEVFSVVELGLERNVDAAFLKEAKKRVRQTDRKNRIQGMFNKPKMRKSEFSC